MQAELRWQCGFSHEYARVRETASLPHDEAADRIISSVQAWSSPQNDDLTILICDYIGGVYPSNK
jgi:hypothetical protein